MVSCTQKYSIPAVVTPRSDLACHENIPAFFVLLTHSSASPLTRQARQSKLKVRVIHVVGLRACSPAVAAAADWLLDPALATLLTCAKRNLQQVSVYLHARVHVSSFWLKPSLMLASPILSREIAYGSFSPGTATPGLWLPRRPEEIGAGALSTYSPSWRKHSKNATMPASNRR